MAAVGPLQLVLDGADCMKDELYDNAPPPALEETADEAAALAAPMVGGGGAANGGGGGGGVAADGLLRHTGAVSGLTPPDTDVEGALGEVRGWGCRYHPK